MERGVGDSGGREGKGAEGWNNVTVGVLTSNTISLEPVIFLFLWSLATVLAASAKGECAEV